MHYLVGNCSSEKETHKIWAKWRLILTCNKCHTGYPFLFQVQKPYPWRRVNTISVFVAIYSTVGERVPICRLNMLLKIKAVSFLLYRKQGTKLNLRNIYWPGKGFWDLGSPDLELTVMKHYLKKDHRSYICNLCSCETKAWRKIQARTGFERLTSECCTGIAEVEG